jgi:hypothetical protein
MRNRRWASQAASQAVVTVSILALGLCSVAVATPSASTASCKQVLVIGVRGSAETSKNFAGFGETVVREVNRLGTPGHRCQPDNRGPSCIPGSPGPTTYGAATGEWFC